MKNRWTIILIIVLLSACDKTQEEQACYQAVIDDYTEKITVNGSIEAVSTTFLKAPRMFLSTIVWIEEDGKMVQAGDTVCILEHPDMSSNLENQKEELEKINSQLEKLMANHEVKLAMLEAEIENNKIQLSINSLDSIQKKFAPPLQQKLISLEQQKANILKSKLEKKYIAQKTIGETEIRGITSRIRQKENSIQRSQDEMKELIIIAPKGGLLIREEAPRISFMTGDGFGSIGGKIQAGSSTWTNMNILQIPELEKMQVKAELTESNYKRAKEGQKVYLNVEAKNNLITTGVIKRKMLTGRQQNRNSNVKMYEALIEIDSCHKQLIPGMNALCDIIINDLKDTLAIPAIAVFEDKDEKYVYVKEGKKFRKTIIETGLVNGSYCIIKSGLPVNSFIALSEPSKKNVIREKVVEQESQPVDSLDLDVTGSDSLQISHRLNAIHYE